MGGGTTFSPPGRITLGPDVAMYEGGRAGGAACRVGGRLVPVEIGIFGDAALVWDGPEFEETEAACMSASLNSKTAVSVPFRRTTVLLPMVSDQLTLASMTPV